MRWLAPVLLVVPVGAAAQTAQPWPSLLVTAPLAGPISAGIEAIYRVSPDSIRASQSETRGWLFLTESPRLRFALGYGHIVTYQPSGPDTIENQAAEQMTWTALALPRLRLIARTRLEERVLRDNDGTGLRLREQLRLELPVARNRAALVAWCEPFVNLARTRLAAERIDQVRSFAGIHMSAGRRMGIELGYLNQYRPHPGGAIRIDAVPIIVSYGF